VRILLDENIAHKLRLVLADFETFTVQYMGFASLKNGELLRQAEASGFDVFITGDKTMEYEQDMRNRKIAVISLSACHWQIVKPHVGRIVLAVKSAAPGSFTRVECGAFSRKRKPQGPTLG
jgi:putative NIF3 family GTP cyclohydrolase 1 type 2